MTRPTPARDLFRGVVHLHGEERVGYLDEHAGGDWQYRVMRGFGADAGICTDVPAANMRARGLGRLLKKIRAAVEVAGHEVPDIVVVRALTAERSDMAYAMLSGSCVR